MILYHGTSDCAAKSIFKDRKIRKSCKEISHYASETGVDKTSFGYVYLTSSIEQAIYYGKKASKKEPIQTAYIFEINIDINLLVEDKDECDLKLLSLELREKCMKCNAYTCIKTIQSARYPEDLFIRDEVQRFKVVNTCGSEHKLVSDWQDVSQYNRYIRIVSDWFYRKRYKI